MATRAKRVAAQGRRERASAHEGFLRHRNFLWLKIAAGLSILALAIYLMIDVKPRPNGGSWYGYTLGSFGALLILWLTLLGLRKRAMTRGRWSLKAWTSAHVYLGLSLVVVATLHTGFQFGWNVHTLAYALMMLVILSGIFGIVAYSTLPKALSSNRDETTQTQMLDNLRALDRQLHDAAQPLDHHMAAAVRASLDEDPFGGGLWARLTGRYRHCATARAQGIVRGGLGPRSVAGGDPLAKIDQLLERKRSALARVREHVRIRALLEVWLYVHVPVTFALIAALTAHILSVFYYW